MKRSLYLLFVFALISLGACSVRPAENVRDLSEWSAVAAPLQVQAPKAGRDRHLVLVLAHNAGAETTDFVIPYAVLQQSGLADVQTAAPLTGVVPLFPALKVRIEQSLADFDRRYPDGADIVIVPAYHQPDDPVIIAWLQAQAASGALIVGICDGTWSLAHAGLLSQRLATGHWFSLNKLADKFGDSRWVKDQRYVQDGNVITTTGVSASIPVSLALVAAMSDESTAQELARQMGEAPHAAVHDSESFSLGADKLMHALSNRLQFWSSETRMLGIEQGVDDIALALTADAWSRTWRSRALTSSLADREEVKTRHGLKIVVDRPGADAVQTVDGPVALHQVLAEISQQYGERTANFVAVQLEYIGAPGQ